MSTLPPLPFQQIEFEPEDPAIAGAPQNVRRLSDLAGCFADARAYQTALSAGDPVIYRVYSLTFGEGGGDLSYGFGMLLPGRVGAEYTLTKGHLHRWRDAAEVYIGLSGEGFMLLQEETTGESRLIPFGKNMVVYVPGHTAHRTINTGDEPLTYLGVYPARAGHDYGFIEERGFAQVVIEVDGRPALQEREAFLDSLKERP
jgi:glucose-6-phosphate isomerase